MSNQDAVYRLDMCENEHKLLTQTFEESSLSSRYGTYSSKTTSVIDHFYKRLREIEPLTKLEIQAQSEKLILNGTLKLA